jgi:hypothetical protein
MIPFLQFIVKMIFTTILTMFMLLILLAVTLFYPVAMFSSAIRNQLNNTRKNLL